MLRDMDETVELAVYFFDALEAGFGNGHRRDFASADGGRQFFQWLLPEIAVHGVFRYGAVGSKTIAGCTSVRSSSRSLRISPRMSPYATSTSCRRSGGRSRPNNSI